MKMLLVYGFGYIQVTLVVLQDMEHNARGEEGGHGFRLWFMALQFMNYGLNHKLWIMNLGCKDLQMSSKIQWGEDSMIHILDTIIQISQRV